MIGVKDAVSIAFGLFRELYDTSRFEDVLLEAVEQAPDKKTWEVIIGFARRAPAVNIVESFGSRKYFRSYKLFRIDAQSGEMVAMKSCPGEERPQQ